MHTFPVGQSTAVDSGEFCTNESFFRSEEESSVADSPLVCSVLAAESREVTDVMLVALATAGRWGLCTNINGGVEFGGRWTGLDTLRRCPLSCASSSKTERARQDILARDASISRLLLLLHADISRRVLVSETGTDVVVNDRSGSDTAVDTDC